MSSPWVPRVLLGVGIVALIAGIVSLSVGTGGPENIKISGGEDVQQLIAGGQQDGSALGSPRPPVARDGVPAPPDAPVTLTVFTDLQCSTGDTYQLDTIEPLIEKYARGDEVRFELHNYS